MPSGAQRSDPRRGRAPAPAPAARPAAAGASLEPCEPPPILSDPNPGPLRSVLHFSYDALWVAAVLVASPWWLWRCARARTFRAMALGRLTAGLPAAPRPGEPERILFHGVSVGEVKAAQPLVRLIEREHPELRVVISTTTPTGFEVARQLYGRHTVVRFPLDPSFLVRRFLRRVAPRCVVLMELEIWPNFLRCANQAGVPVAVANGRITSDSFAHYRLFRRLLPQFNRISLFCVQDEEYARRFRELSRDSRRLLVTGNVKADGLELGPTGPGQELARLLGGRAGQAVLVAGSTHEPEEVLLARAWRAHVPAARLVIVPRHPARAERVLAQLEGLGLRPQLLTALRAGREAPDPARPAIVDTIGDLEQIYGLADLVFVGGSLAARGGQNMLEPAARGRPVLYGPHVDNFWQEAALLERAGASLRLAGPAQLGACLGSLLADDERRRAMSRAGLSTVATQRGASRRTLEALRRRGLIPREPVPDRT